MSRRGPRSRLAGLVCALLTAAALLSAGDAAAKTVTLKGGTAYRLEGHHGPYRFQLSVQEDGYFIVVSKDHGDLNNAYFVKGRPSARGLDADFGRFGKLDLKFRAVGSPKELKGLYLGCHKPPLEQKGVFTGDFRFRGEEGFVEIHAGRLTGASITTQTQKCGGFEGGEAEEEEAIELSASNPTGSLSFSAISVAGPRGAPICLFSASDTQRHGRVIEFRTAGAFGHRKNFEFDEALSSASARPGSPFEGSATFERAANGSVTWSGDLRADFLGGSERLTGGRIEASLGKSGESSAPTIVVVQKREERRLLRIAGAR